MIRDEALTKLGFASYEEYLASPQWQLFRSRFLSAVPAPLVCNRCRAAWWACELVYGQRVNLHHKTYKNIGKEKFDDIEILCRRCHELQHFGKSNAPQIVLRACRYCTRPKVTLDPPVPVESLALVRSRDDLESIGEIISRKHSKMRRVGKVTYRKLLEVMNHPTCRAPL